jgi:hypothetical protein
VDITELSYFLAVVKPIYSLQIFLPHNSGKRRCQVRQVDITELSYFLAVVKAIYSLQIFLADNGDGRTNL